MDRKTWRTIRKDLTVLTSICLLGLVGLAALTGMGMDEEAEGLLPVDDIHALVGYSLALLAGAHVLLQAGVLTKYAKKRLRDLAGEPQRRGAGQPGGSAE